MIKGRGMKWWRKGGFTGRVGDSEVAGTVHGPSVVLPRHTFDRLGEDQVRALFGRDVEITIIEEKQ